MLEFGVPGPEHRDGIAAVAGLAFNYQPRPQSISVDSALCAFDRGKVVAAARSIPLRQWWGGARVSCAGVAGVVVLPEYRGRGLAAGLVRGLLAARRDAGDAVSVLYPANSPLYRRLGYEYAGLCPEFSVPVTDLPPAKGDVREASLPGDLPALMACFSEYARRHNGPVESRDPDHWADHVLAHKDEGGHQRTVMVDAEAGTEGYASYFLGEWQRGGYPLTCKHLVAVSGSAFASLLGYFRRHENSASTFTWRGPPSTAPLGLAASSSGFSIEPHLRRWMLRVLDVPAALGQRGYARPSGEAVLEVEDPLFPPNTGAWRVQVEKGKARVEKTSDRPKNALTIGMFSALYSGLASPWDLTLLGGGARDEGEMAAIADLFYGPVPWMPDFF